MGWRPPPVRRPPGLPRPRAQDRRRSCGTPASRQREERSWSRRTSIRARRMWRALEPYHAVVYFAPEPQAACTELGTRGYWMSYFALRAAPLGAAPPELVAALFYGFAPRLVARAVPDTWRVAAPERFLAVRLEAVDAALHRLLGAETLRVGRAWRRRRSSPGRPRSRRPPPGGRWLRRTPRSRGRSAPHLVLWHAQTVLREQRGDGHVAALLTAGLDPVESLALHRRRHRDGPGLDAHPPRLDRGRVGGRRGPAGRAGPPRPGTGRSPTRAGHCAPRWRRTPTPSRTYRARRSATPAPPA